MKRLKAKKINRERRVNRIRSVVYGTPKKPRLIVSVSNYNVSAQIVDDTAGKTVVAVTTSGTKQSGSMTEKAAWVGTEIAAKAKSGKIKHVSFDRRGKKYHGRVRSLADAARKGGLEF